MKKYYLLGFIFFLVSSSLHSHQRSESYSKISIERGQDSSQIQVEFSLQTSVLQNLDEGYSNTQEDKFINEILEGFEFKNCDLDSSPFLKNSFSTGYLSLFWRLRCAPQDINIKFNVFFDKDSSHTHIATFLIDSRPFPEKVFSVSNKEWSDSEKYIDKAGDLDSFYDYLSLGFKHILSGFDHLAFLLALLVLSLPIKKLILIITGFTLGHSLTLALGALNLINPSSQLVEALIGYSIIIIAVECVSSITKSYKLHINILSLMWFILLIGLLFLGYQKFLIGLIGMGIFSFCYLNLISRYKDFSLTIFVTCLFGLIHGFGFAGNLSNIGLMEGRLLPAIFGFNLGVELGQILVVIIFLSISLIVNRFLKQDLDQLRVYAASGLACIGTFWFLERLF